MRYVFCDRIHLAMQTNAVSFQGIAWTWLGAAMRRKIAALEPFLRPEAIPGTGDNPAVLCVRAATAIALAAIASASLVIEPSPVLADNVIPSCAGSSFEMADVVGVRDGATLRLSDGREVRLAGVIAPNEVDGDAKAVAEAGSALATLAVGKRVVLHGGDRPDRYGRLAAHVASTGEGQRWIQAELVASGALRVAPEAGTKPCTEALIGFERSARANRKGLWSEPHFSVVKADDLATLNTASGRFAVVEGSVTRVGETSTRTYLDFGRRYTEDFTIVIPRHARAAFAGAGIDLKSLRGKRVRVRGVLFSSGGPAIEIRRPASLEILTDRDT